MKILRLPPHEKITTRRLETPLTSKNRLTTCFASATPFLFPPPFGLQTPAKVADLHTIAVSCLASATADANCGNEEPGAVILYYSTRTP